MRMKDFAMWDWGHRVTLGVGVVNGTVPVRESVRERAVGVMGVLAGNSDSVIKVKKKLKEAQSSLEDDPFNINRKLVAVKLLNEYNEAVEDELKLLHQGTKIKWLKEGDWNSKYFYSVLKSKKHKNKVEFICEEDGSGYIKGEKLSEDEANGIFTKVTDEEIKSEFLILDPKKLLVLMVSLLVFLKTLGLRLESIFMQLSGNSLLVKFFRGVLVQVGFHVVTVKWIMACITSTSFSFHVNGETYGYLKGGRGLRDIDSIKVVKKALDELSNVSSLFLNPNKSTIFFESINEGLKREMLQVLPFKCGNLPMKYLGVPLVAKRLGVVNCKCLIENYWASVYMLPIYVFNDLDKVLKRFLWNVRDSAKGKARVAWSLVCRPKDQGGLGLKPLKRWNEVMEIVLHYGMISGVALVQ
nr:hypothetical protein [Tanacetum cinerariifolium]